jgi:hypothetical protein
VSAAVYTRTLLRAPALSGDIVATVPPTTVWVATDITLTRVDAGTGPAYAVLACGGAVIHSLVTTDGTARRLAAHWYGRQAAVAGEELEAFASGGSFDVSVTGFVFDAP